MIVQSYTSWQPLEEVIVGKVFDPQEVEFISNLEVREKIQQILHESIEDLDNLSKVIEQFGATVKRPAPTAYQMSSLFIPMPALTPRDWQITLGEKLLRTLRVAELNSIIDEYERQQPGCVVDPQGLGYDSDHVMANAVASCVVRVGRDIFFDNSEWLTDAQMHWIQQHVLDSRYRVRRARTNGHGDAVFAILKPGVIISSMHDSHIDYAADFPGWQVHRVDHATVDAFLKIGQFRAESFDGRWYSALEKIDDEFRNFVDQYLSHWVGYAKETVFDINCLVLDEQHTIFSNYNQGVFDFCEKNHITPIICELRHKFFWDGGISCCTQDIRRRGPLEDYFS